MGNIRLINELPHIYELRDLLAFCRSNKKIYIYGFGLEMQYMHKYLEMNEIKIEGYIDSWIPDDDFKFVFRKIPIIKRDEVVWNTETGIVVAIPDSFYEDVIPYFRSIGFNNYILLTEYSKRAIANQVTPRNKELYTLEISLAYHCNMSCKCCDHYSQLSKKRFPQLRQLEKDIRRIGVLFDHFIDGICLSGGEPTLNPNLIECITICRKEFPRTVITVMTNGILLEKWENSCNGNLWQICKDNDVIITVTEYPIDINYDKIRQLAHKYGIELNILSDVHNTNNNQLKPIDKHLLSDTKEKEKFLGVSCLYFNKFNVLQDGRIYMCPICANIGILNQKFHKSFEVNHEDYIDIYEVDDWHEIVEFSSKVTDFCKYCDLENWGQDGLWERSKISKSEYLSDYNTRHVFIKKVIGKLCH